MASDKATIEVLRSALGCCVTVNDTRVAGPKLLGGASVMLTFSSDKKRILGALADENEPDPWELLRELSATVDEWDHQTGTGAPMNPGPKYHMARLANTLRLSRARESARVALKQQDAERSGQ